MTLWIETNGTQLTEAEIKAGTGAAQEVLNAFEWRRGAHQQIDAHEARAAYLKDADAEPLSPRETVLVAAWIAAERAAIEAATAGWAEVPEDLSLAP